MLDELDRTAVRRWASTCVDVLAAHRDELDRLNVFPVADADTGTNLLVTMRAAGEALDAATATKGDVGAGGLLHAMAGGAMLGARGNSGLVLSQLLRGLAQAGAAAPVLGAGWLGDGLRLGAALARAAFATPVDGTALTVLDAASAAAADAGSDKLSAVADAAVSAATAAVADTPRLLDVLARAGVVDAGGRGVLLLLDALAAVVARRPAMAAAAPRLPRTGEALSAPREVGGIGYDYEVMYLLDDSTDARVARLRAELATIGDSVAIVGDGTTWNVHVHCTDVGVAIEAGIEAGRPHRITVVRFADQVAVAPPAASLVVRRAVVAVAPGGGLAQLFGGEGVTVVAPADGSDVTADAVLAAITATRAAHVVVLPNAADGTAVAEAAAELAREAGHDVVVVPTASPAQGLAALAVHDPARRAGDDVVAMAEAAAATRCGEVTIAAEEALTWVGRCYPGDVLGLVDGEVVLIAGSVVAAGCALVDRMLDVGGELVTVLLGADAPAELPGALADGLRRGHPEVELVVYHGDQPGSPLLVGVE